MMNSLQLQLLDATLRREPVLSVYLGLATSSNMDRWIWSLDFGHSLQRIRELLTKASHDEREKFEAAARRAERALRELTNASAGSTWVAFVTAGGIRHSEVTTLFMPTTVAWGEGMRLAPYVRVMNDEVPVVAIVADSTHLDLWECSPDRSRLVERIHAHQPANHEAPHLSAVPATPGFHTGTRGGIGHDELQRQRRNGTTRMLELGATRARQMAGPAGWLCVGGIAHIAKRLVRALALPARAQTVKLDVHASAADIASVALTAVREMRDRQDAFDVRDTLDSASRTGFGVLGAVETLSALERGRVRDLFLSERYLSEHLEDAEFGVRHARRQGARVVVLRTTGAAGLDEQGGIAARLRYRLDGFAAPPRTA